MKNSMEMPPSSEKAFEITDEEAIERAEASVRENSRLGSEASDTFPHVLDDSIKGEVTERYPNGAVEVTVEYKVAFSSDGRPAEEGGSVYRYGPLCEKCLGSGHEQGDKQMGCGTCGGWGVKVEHAPTESRW